MNSHKAPVKGFVYYAVAIAALGGLLFGYDTGVISGAILFITKQFSLSSTMEEIVVSAVLIGAVAGASVGGALTDRFGRRRFDLHCKLIGDSSGALRAASDRCACGERNRHRAGVVPISDVHRRTGSRESAGRTRRREYACDHDRDRCSLSDGLCIDGKRRLAMDVRTRRGSRGVADDRHVVSPR